MKAFTEPKEDGSEAKYTEGEVSCMIKRWVDTHDAEHNLIRTNNAMVYGSSCEHIHLFAQIAQDFIRHPSFVINQFCYFVKLVTYDLFVTHF